MIFEIKNLKKQKLTDELKKNNEKYEMLKEEIRKKINDLTPEQPESSKILYEEINRISEERYLQEKLFEAELARIDACKTLRDLNLNFDEACEFLKLHNIPIVLGPDDKVITDNKCDYNSLDDIMLVRKTEFIPSNNQVLSPANAKAKRNSKINLAGKEYNLEYVFERKSIHFSANGEVTEHEYGTNWDSYKYTILIPFNEIPRENILSMSPEDTYTNSNVILTDKSWILCPEGEGNLVKQQNPNVNVIQYIGNPKDYANAFLSTLGYRTEETHKFGWYNEKSSASFENLRKKEGFEIDLHIYSKAEDETRLLTYINKIEALAETIDRNFVLNQDLINSLYEDIMKQDIDIFNEFFNNNSFCINTILKKLSEKGLNIPYIYATLLNLLINPLTITEKTVNETYTKIQYIINILPNLLDLDEIAKKDLQDIFLSVNTNNDVFVPTHEKVDKAKYAFEKAKNSLLTHAILEGIRRKQIKEKKIVDVEKNENIEENFTETYSTLPPISPPQFSPPTTPPVPPNAPPPFHSTAYPSNLSTIPTENVADFNLETEGRSR